jgi:hypothetical protein
MRRTPSLVATLLAVSAVALTAACAAATAGLGHQGHPAGTRHPVPPPALPPGQIVYQIGSDGGSFIAADYHIATEPDLTIYGNGDVYESEGPGPGATAGKPWTFRIGHVPLSTLARLVADAESSGQFGKADFGMPAISDVGGTAVLIRPSHAAAQSIDVYALDFTETADGLTRTEVANRTALRHLVARFAHAVHYQGDATWQPDRVAVIQRDPSGSTEPVGSGDGTPAQPWPGPAPARLLTRHTPDGLCGVVRGPAAAALYRAALAHGSTHWTVDGADAYLLVKAVLPGEPGCPG